MGQFVSQDDYTKVINVCLEGFQGAPVKTIEGYQCFVCTGACSVVLPPFCIFFGPYFWYYLQQNSAMNKSIGQNLTATGVQGARLEFPERADASGGQWIDHRGKELLVNGTLLGGPPLGYNLVFQTGAEMAWPPQQVQAAPVQPAMVGNAAAANFCASCGKQREGTGNFCSGCGAAFG